MSVAAIRVWNSNKCKETTRLICLPISIFIVHLIFNFSWTYIFFTMKRPDLALLDIVIMTSLVSSLTYTFWKHDIIAGWLMIPYLIWSLFATYLNMVIVFKN
jgi:tryptophan-rich sensory protein